MFSKITRDVAEALRPFCAERTDDLLLIIGALCCNTFLGKKDISSFRDIEYKVFSQWGEDGIIQYLVQNISIENDYFIEFGVQDYTESNTRFLLQNNNWSGLIIDGCKKNIETIRKDNIYWRHDITAVQAFITKHNINDLLGSHVKKKDIGLLSIDIDGNDYWVWEAIDAVEPRVVICEYNSLFGEQRAVSIPYSDDFVRTRTHHSNLYFGASIQALIHLASMKGYIFIGTNSAGNNAFFIRNDVYELCTDSIRQLKPIIHRSKFREARDRRGYLTYASREENIKMIAHLPVVDVISGETINIESIYLGHSES